MASTKLLECQPIGGDTNRRIRLTCVGFWLRILLNIRKCGSVAGRFKI